MFKPLHLADSKKENARTWCGLFYWHPVGGIKIAYTPNLREFSANPLKCGRCERSLKKQVKKITEPAYRVVSRRKW